MKIGIVGLGVVGNACKEGFEALGHTIVCHDLKLKSNIEDVLDTEVCYLCLPTPSLPSGGCDTSIVYQAVEDLTYLDYDGVIAIKSTVPPGFTEKLIEELNHYICFVPEFLRERCAKEDFISNHKLLAIGTSNDHVFEIVKASHGSYPVSVVRMKPSEAELLKYYSNVYNALRITFANDLFEVCKTLNISYDVVKDAFLKRDSLGAYLLASDELRGYGGPCLPKDVKAFVSFIKELGLDISLFEAMEKDNSKYKTTVFDGMRK